MRTAMNDDRVVGATVELTEDIGRLKAGARGVCTGDLPDHGFAVAFSDEWVVFDYDIRKKFVIIDKENDV